MASHFVKEQSGDAGVLLTHYWASLGARLFCESMSEL